MFGLRSDDEDHQLDPDELMFYAGRLARIGRMMLEKDQRAKEHAERWLKYYDDPIGFFRNELLIDPWETEDPEQHGQADLIRAVGAHSRVACKSGHKIGKSITAVGLALWFVCTRKKARVLLTAPTFHQVKNILWKELANIYRERNLKAAFGVELALDPATGLKLPNGNEIIGISTKTKENLAGISSAEMLFIVDEATGFPDDLWEVLNKGNAAGGVKIFCLSNPTRTSGWFFNLFRQRERFSHWKTFTISSENTPNVRCGKKIVPGLAEADFIDIVRKECGDDYINHPEYMVRIRGEFPPQGGDSVVSLLHIERAQKRWKSATPEQEFAELSIGVDVGRFGTDPSVVQPVRGCYAYLPKDIYRADGHQVAALVIAYAEEIRINGEVVRVVVDGIGVGASVVDALKYSDPVQEGWMYIVDLNCGESPDDEKRYERLRDELWFSCAAWIKEDGKLHTHESLSEELLAATYAFTIRNKRKVVGKDVLRAVMGRSPDYADALAMAVYNGPRGAIYKADALITTAPDLRHGGAPVPLDGENRVGRYQGDATDDVWEG